MWQRWSSYHQRVIIIMIRHLLLGLPYRLVEHTAPSHLNGWSWWSEWWWWLWSLTKDVDDNIDDYKEEEWGTYVNMWWSISDKDDDLAKWKKKHVWPNYPLHFSSSASWLQSLINLQLFFFVIVVLLLIWWWRGWWRWRLLKIVTAPKRSGFHSSLARGAQINFLASNRFPLIRLLLRWDPTFFFFKLSFL